MFISFDVNKTYCILIYRFNENAKHKLQVDLFNLLIITFAPAMLVSHMYILFILAYVLGLTLVPNNYCFNAELYISWNYT